MRRRHAQMILTLLTVCATLSGCSGNGAYRISTSVDGFSVDTTPSTASDVDRPLGILAWDVDIAAQRGGRVWFHLDAGPPNKATIIFGGSQYSMKAGEHKRLSIGICPIGNSLFDAKKLKVVVVMQGGSITSDCPNPIYHCAMTQIPAVSSLPAGSIGLVQGTGPRDGTKPPNETVLRLSFTRLPTKGSLSGIKAMGYPLITVHH